jgi:hypothetical protein
MGKRESSHSCAELKLQMLLAFVFMVYEGTFYCEKVGRVAQSV